MTEQEKAKRIEKGTEAQKLYIEIMNHKKKDGSAWGTFKTCKNTPEALPERVTINTMLLQFHADDKGREVMNISVIYTINGDDGTGSPGWVLRMEGVKDTGEALEFTKRPRMYWRSYGSTEKAYNGEKYDYNNEEEKKNAPGFWYYEAGSLEHGIYSWRGLMLLMGCEGYFLQGVYKTCKEVLKINRKVDKVKKLITDLKR